MKYHFQILLNIEEFLKKVTGLVFPRYSGINLSSFCQRLLAWPNELPQSCYEVNQSDTLGTGSFQ